MTVKQLIVELKKMPQHLEVYTQDHDNSEYELSGHPNCVILWDKKDMMDKVNELPPSMKRLSQSELEGIPEKICVLR